MNRPRRPGATPPRKRPSGPPRGAPTEGGPPRRRTPLDLLPQTETFKVLGTADRQTLQTGASPMELVVIHGFTREVEEAFQKFHGRIDDFWAKHPHLINTLHKLDEVLAGVQARKPG